MILRFALVLSLTGLATLSVAEQATPSDPAKPKEELQSLRSQIDSLQKQLQQNEATKAEASDALKESEQAISDANRILDDLSSRHAETQSQLQFYKNELSKKRRQTIASQHDLSKLLRVQYQQGVSSKAAQLLLSNSDPAEAARQLKYYQYIAQAQAELIKQLRQDMAELNRLVADIAQREQELAKIRGQKAQQKDQLQQQKKTRQQTLNKLASEINAQRNEITRLRENEKRLTRLVDQLNRLIEQRQRAAKLAAEKAAKREQQRAQKQDTAPRHTGSRPPEKPARQPATDFGNSGFAALRGQLRQPVQGDISNRFGSSRAEGAGTWKGVFIRTSTGAEIRSVASGQVVFADWLRGFGNLIIVDHGGGYMSLYGHNEALLKQVGTQVKAGDVIARAGNSGGNAETGLYFEIRRLGAPVDPAQWIRF